MTKKVLVLGKTGQLASVLQKVVSNTNTKNLNNIKDLEFQFLSRQEFDLMDNQQINDLFTKFPCDFCINTIAYTNVDLAETEEGGKLNNLINSQQLTHLSQKAAEQSIFIIHISTDYVYGGNANCPINEETVTNPINAYGCAKLLGEKNILDNNPNSIIIRTSWLYSDFGKNFFLTFKLLTEQKPEVRVIIDQIGSPTNAYDLANSLVVIISTIIKNPETELGNRIFNFSNLGVASWYDFAVHINKYFNHSCQIIPIPSAQYPTLAARPTFSLMDKTKIITTFGLSIRHWTEFSLE
jgi:dTDP-4-dehydrorhamnose reductase